MTHKLLIIDTDVQLCNLVAAYLNQEGFQVEQVHDSDAGIKRALNQSYDLIVLDLMMPQTNGFSLLKTLREHQSTPVLLFTARTDDIDKVLGLELGADDFLNKPANPRELLARIRAVLRRTPKQPQARKFMQSSSITLDSASRQVIKENQPIELTHTEFNILEMLMRSPGQAFSKAELTEYALGRSFGHFDRAIDVHISHLRQKLGLNPRAEPLLKTVRGFGYAFNE